MQRLSPVFHNYLFQIECIDVCGKNLYIGTNDWYVELLQLDSVHIWLKKMIMRNKKSILSLHLTKPIKYCAMLHYGLRVFQMWECHDNCPMVHRNCNRKKFPSSWNNDKNLEAKFFNQVSFFHLFLYFSALYCITWWKRRVYSLERFHFIVTNKDRNIWLW